MSGYTTSITTVGTTPDPGSFKYFDTVTYSGTVVTAGDVDGGGRDDAILSTRFRRNTTSYNVCGSSISNYDADRVFIVFSEVVADDAVGTLSLDDQGSGVAKVALPEYTTVTALHAGVDINGDGYKDLVIGVKPDNTGGSYQVVAYVVFGGPSLRGATIDAGEMGSSQGFIVMGPAVPSEGYVPYDYVSITSGDVNGDGRPDVIIGLEGRNVGNTTDGRVYVIFGIAPGAEFPEYVPEA